ncbi:MAG: NAD(P)/FAD-dependent oxidoreductase [Nitrospinota bacterium]|nr:NAD(P)/FAD-dependent oxidoreductase [Nitrospinota bacterium]
MSKRGLKNIKSEYDVIVIGAGLGGLTCANMLGRRGYSVLLLEHHTHLGGLAAYFKRKKHIFDVALHGFPVGMIKTCRKYWNADMADRIVPLKRIIFDNPQFSLETTYTKDDFTKLLIEKFGVPAETVEAFFEHTRSMNFYDNDKRTVRELFQEYFPDRDDVWRLLMEPITYANGSTLDEPAITYGIVFSNFMNKGVYTFQGGTDLIIKMMEEELLKNGVDVRTKVLVEKIGTENGAVTGVVANGEFIKSKAVVSNANLISTVLEMLDKEAITSEFRQQTEKVQVNNSSCQVYIGIKNGEKIDDIGELLFTSTAPKFNAEMMRSMDVTSRTFSVYYPYARPGHDRYTIVSSTNANYDDWASLSENEYKEAKEHLIETTLEALEKYVPGVRGKIDHLEAATPKTFLRYTRHLGGSSFGTKFEGLEISNSLPNMVGGLFFTGSVGIIMSGWLGAANYGVIISNDVDKYMGKLGV